MIASFNQFELLITLSQARTTKGPGDVTEQVHELVATPYIRRQLDKIGPEKIAQELEGLGAWDDDELADHEANRVRIVWIAASTILEENE